MPYLNESPNLLFWQLSYGFCLSYIFSILYTPLESVLLLASNVKLSPSRNSTIETKGFAMSLDKKVAPLREAGCGIGVSVGGRVGIAVGVKVGDGIDVSVEVGAIVAVGSIATCPLQADNRMVKNKSIDENCEIIFFIFSPDDLILQEAAQWFAACPVGTCAVSR